MTDKLIQNEASEAKAELDSVHVHGPADVDFSLTPTEALESAMRIEEAAVEAIINGARGSKIIRKT